MSTDDLYIEPNDLAERVMSVGELTDRIKGALETQFPLVWVSGEISNFSRPQSGHCYLTLKDEQAQMRAVMWRTAASRVRFELEDGLEVICQGSLDVYPPRGSYQLVIRQIEPKGVGALELALRKLREKLAAEGLFAPERKRPLPRFPRRVAFVTSPTGAAVRDFLEVLRRRWRGVHVLIVPVRVQGDGAAREIAAGIELANRLTDPLDLIVVGRGGGSLEDLWCFNEEVVVRAIHASRLPVVSAVGHEIDVTLADLVADVRALTPSEAAERIAPAIEEVAALVDAYRDRLCRALAHLVAAARARVDALACRRVFRNPLERTQVLAQRLDECSLRARRAIERRKLAAMELLKHTAHRLESLSPLSVLARGYSVTSRESDGQIVGSVRQVVTGERIRTRVADGEITSRIESSESSGLPSGSRAPVAE